MRDSNVEVATMGRGASLSGAAALTIRNAKSATDATHTKETNGEDSKTILDTGSDLRFPTGDSVGEGAGALMGAVLSAASSQSSWRVRRNAAAVACVLQTRLHFVLTPAQHRAADAALLSLLGDPRREVQETARLAVSTRVAHLPAAQARTLCEKFAARADNAAASRKKRRKIARRQAAAGVAADKMSGEATAATAAARSKSALVVMDNDVENGGGSSEGTGESLGELRAQQTSVLGLSAVVLAAPCDVPLWVPGALESLARHVNDQSPGRLPVRQTVSGVVGHRAWCGVCGRFEGVCLVF